MNADLPAIPRELDAHHLANAAIRFDPELGRLLPADELHEHLARFCRALRRSAEREAIARKDTAT